MTTFILHPQLEKDSIFIADLPLCQLRLINDARFVWCLLVPCRPDITEITQLTGTDYVQLMAETRQLGAALLAEFDGDKLNIGALGNMVPQLHMHVIIRKRGDAAWPGAVWGSGISRPYPEDYLPQITKKIASLVA